MRRFESSNKPCESCGRVTHGRFVTYAGVLDFGVPTMPLIEPNMMEPKRCDDCELLAKLADPAYLPLYGPTADRDAREALARGARPPAPR